MAYKLVFTESYTRRASRFIRKHPELRRQYEKTLRLHKLKGQLAGLHSVSINMSYRITIEILIEGTTIIPVTVGPHDDVY